MFRSDTPRAERSRAVNSSRVIFSSSSVSNSCMRKGTHLFIIVCTFRRKLVISSKNLHFASKVTIRYVFVCYTGWPEEIQDLALHLAASSERVHTSYIFSCSLIKRLYMVIITAKTNLMVVWDLCSGRTVCVKHLTLLPASWLHALYNRHTLLTWHYPSLPKSCLCSSCTAAATV